LLLIMCITWLLDWRQGQPDSEGLARGIFDCQKQTIERGCAGISQRNFYGRSSL